MSQDVCRTMIVRRVYDYVEVSRVACHGCSIYDYGDRPVRWFFADNDFWAACKLHEKKEGKEGTVVSGPVCQHKLYRFSGECGGHLYGLKERVLCFAHIKQLRRQEGWSSDNFDVYEVETTETVVKKVTVRG